MKAPKIVKIIGLIWIVALLAAATYYHFNWEKWVISGKWFNEDMGILVISPNGTMTINGTECTWEKIAPNAIEPRFLNGGGSRSISISRNAEGIVWKSDHQEYSFEKLPSSEKAVVDRTIESAPEATLIRRWTEDARPQRLIVLKNGDTGFNDNFIRLFLNSKHCSSLHPNFWIPEFTVLANTGKLIDSFEEIPRYFERPLQKEPELAATRTKTSEGFTKVVRHSYLQLGGKVYRIEAIFKGQHCLKLSHELLEDRIGAAKYYQ